ncbi:MAG TPA: YidB family protein [Acetobacteraceae bacterium]|nr:YidB family protein [Acetobacteraceae bacterium]
MGLFDDISRMAGGGGIAGELMGVLDQHGISGVSGIVQQFEQSGMGNHAASWVGNGENLPVSADQVRQALGNPVVESIARKFGIDTNQAAQLISQHLPDAVDQATPDGQVPEASA